jgi:MSHA pilin protein MshC
MEPPILLLILNQEQVRVESLWDLNIKQRQGFTLIELVIVLVLIGILSVAVVPRLFDVHIFSSRFFYDDVLTSIRYAQKFAVATGCHVEVNVTATALTLTQRANCTTGAFIAAVPDPGSLNATGFTRAAPSGVNMTTVLGTWPLYFDGLGRAKQIDNTVSNFSLTVDSRTISIMGETGFTE